MRHDLSVTCILLADTKLLLFCAVSLMSTNPTKLTIC